LDPALPRSPGWVEARLVANRTVSKVGDVQVHVPVHVDMDAIVSMDVHV
jgi:hypothetical protein